MQEKQISQFTKEEYLIQERKSDIKHEFLNDEIFAMAGASERHNLIVANIIAELRLQLKKTTCRVYPSDMRLEITKTGLYTYPDIMVVCGRRKYSDDHKDTIVNPDVIIEVLSDSTESYDRGDKFAHYRQLDSLKEYLMVSQNIDKIEQYILTSNEKWILTETTETITSVFLESINCELSVSELYHKVD